MLGEVGHFSAPRHHFLELVAGLLGARERAGRAAAVEHGEPVADRVGVAHVVGDEDDADALLAQPRHVAQHHRGLPHPERRGRLVEDQHPGAEIDRPRDRQRLPLAARHGADRLLDVAHVDADLHHLVVRQSVAPRPCGTISNRPKLLTGSRTMKKLRITDISGTRPSPGRRSRCPIERVGRRAERDLLAFKQDLARGRDVVAGERADQRRFAGAVVAEQAMHLARQQRHRDVLERDDVAEMLGQAADFDDRRRHQ